MFGPSVSDDISLFNDEVAAVIVYKLGGRSLVTEKNSLIFFRFQSDCRVERVERYTNISST